MTLNGSSSGPGSFAKTVMIAPVDLLGHGTDGSLVLTVTLSNDADAPRVNSPKRPSTATPLKAKPTATWPFSVTLE